jgi:S-DNA-T family DNA segregation ATPase FtsK/SpoIIIE
MCVGRLFGVYVDGNPGLPGWIASAGELAIGAALVAAAQGAGASDDTLEPSVRAAETTYDKSDPGWSHSTGSTGVHNAGGRFGAWIADMLLYLFGLSAYWWVVFLLFSVHWGYRRLEATEPADRRSFLIAAGFFSLLLASASLEALRVHALPAQLPLTPGGMLGVTIGNLFSRWFGFTGGTLTLLFIGAIGLSLFSGVSWLEVSEKLGEWVERGWAFAVARWQAARDRKIGERGNAP